jgi:anti-sigma factor RsiW
MTAEQARELFSAAVEGELDEATLSELQTAFAADPELAREYAAFEQTLRLLRKTGSEPPTAPNLLPGVQQRLRVRSRGRFYADRFAERLGRGLAPPLLLALVMLALLGLTWLGLSLLQQITVGG